MFQENEYPVQVIISSRLGFRKLTVNCYMCCLSHILLHLPGQRTGCVRLLGAGYFHLEEALCAHRLWLTGFIIFCLNSWVSNTYSLLTYPNLILHIKFRKLPLFQTYHWRAKNQYLISMYMYMHVSLEL